MQVDTCISCVQFIMMGTALLQKSCNMFIFGFFTSCMVEKLASVNGFGFMNFSLFVTLCAFGVLENVSLIFFAAFDSKLR